MSQDEITTGNRAVSHDEFSAMRIRRIGAEVDRVFAAALLSTCVLVLLQLASVPELDAPLQISLHASAAAIPVLVILFWTRWTESLYDFAAPGWCWIFFGPALLAGFVAIAAFIFHFSESAAGLFIAATFLAVFLWERAAAALGERAREAAARAR